MVGENAEKPQEPTTEPSTVGRRTFLKRAAYAAAGVIGATALGLNRFGSNNNPETNPSITPEKNGPLIPRQEENPTPKQEDSQEINKVNKIEFPYEGRDTLTQEEFNSLFDKIYDEGVKVTPETFHATAVFFSQNEDKILISRRNGSNLAPLPDELSNPIEELSFREIVVNSKAFREYKYEPKYPGHFDPLQSHYFFPDDKKPRARHTYITWTENLKPEERTTQARELSTQELFKIAKAITEDFNWSVENNKFLLPSEQNPPEPPKQSIPGESQA